MPGIQTGSAKLQDNRKDEGPGFGLNLSTGLDVLSVVLDATSGNIPAAAMGVAGIANDASGDKLLGEKGGKMLDLASMGMGLGGLAKGALTGGTKLAVEGAEAGAGIADLGKDIGKVAAGTGDDALSLGLDATTALGGAADVADTGSKALSLGGLATESGSEMNLFSNFMEGGESHDAIKQIFEGSGAKEAGFSLKDLMKTMSEAGNKGIGYAQTGADLAELYGQVTGGEMPAPGMAQQKGSSYSGNTVASQMQGRY